MRHIIGLDIGGTKIEGIVFDGKKIVKSLLIVTPKDLASFKYSLSELIRFLSFGMKIEGIGIGTAGVVDPQKGIWVTSPNLKYVKNFDFAGFFRALGFKNIKIDNDANCFTRAEALLGQAKGRKNIIGIILGTGIGSGLYLNGQNYRGSHHSGGEIGHLIINGDTLEHHYQKAKAKGDFKGIGKLLAIRIADLVNIFDPDSIALGGSVSLKEHKKFLAQTVKTVQQYLLNKKLKPTVYVSKIKSAGTLGAALLFK